jgi:hypothetical protein
MRIAIFCEAAADFATVTGLVDRVLVEEGPDWVREHLESYPPGSLREWVGGTGESFFNVHHMDKDMSDRAILRPRGHFQGRHGAPGALVAYNAFLLARSEASRSGVVEAIILVWDMDDQPEERRQGLRQGRDKIAGDVPMILGCPNLEREAWVLAGFVANNAMEHDRLVDERRTLLFDPCAEAHRLRDKDESAPRSAKRIVRRLTNEDFERESLCWTDTPLATLRERGEESGLRAFLDEILPLLPTPLGQGKNPELTPAP